MPKCMESIWNQTYRNFELILVDDGSTDSSGVICDRFQMEHPQVRVIHKPNGGLSSARNAGLDIAAGTYIYFVDSDDYIEPRLLETMVGVMDREQCDWAGFGMIKEDTQGKELEKILFKPVRREISTEEERMTFLLGDLLSYSMGWEAWAHFYRGSIIRQKGLRFASERQVFAEDLLFAFTYCLYARSFVETELCLYHYVQHGNSLMAGARGQNVLPRIHTLALEAYDAVEKAGLTEIQRDFGMIYWHLMEWHARPCIAKMGVAWTAAELKKLEMPPFFPEQPEACRNARRELLRKYGSTDGFVTVAVRIRTQEDLRRAEDCLPSLLAQTLQKLDVLVFLDNGQRLNIQDFRIREVTAANLGKDAFIRRAFAEGCGEYLYFMDVHREIPMDFLEKGCDALKYNRCGTVIASSGQPMFVDMRSLPDRRKFREYLQTNGMNWSSCLFRRDVLRRSGLGNVEDIVEYWPDILLSEDVLLV